MTEGQGWPPYNGDDDAIRFVTAAFYPGQCITFRPTVTTETGGRVDYSHVAWIRAEPTSIVQAIKGQRRQSEKTLANIFFGVCPRFDREHYDKAWQIRTVNAAWADVDTEPDTVLSRIESAGLPAPSIVVNSGRGKHLYWLLDEPFSIDDVDAPLPVLIEWREEDGRKLKREFIKGPDGERLYLDVHRNVPNLSAKAFFVQDVMRGIADAIGGDSTHDLTRLLRLPGTLNRKNQAEGKEPVPCKLESIDSSRRYSFETFAKFADRSPDKDRREKIAKVPLPAVRRLTPAKQDKLSAYILACDVADKGERSDADFALVCHAIEHGIDREVLWSMVSGVGKFAESGRKYFDTTWGSAADHTRERFYEKAKAKSDRRSTEKVTVATAAIRPSSGTSRVRIVVDQATPVHETLGKITDCLLTSGGCYTRVGQLVSIKSDSISAILSPAALAGQMSRYAEFYFVKGEEAEYKPLPTNYANTWLHNFDEFARLPAISVVTRAPVYTCDWRLVPPGYDAKSGIYYLGPKIEPLDCTQCIDALLSEFCFKSPGDRTNYIAILLTAVLTPHFVGSKPALLLNGNQSELGKSILAQTVAIVRDGSHVETATYNPNDEEFEKRLGAIVRNGATTIPVDNAKATGRNPRIESATLERSITDPILSFRLLGSSSSIKAENSAQFIITANCSDVSRDLITRSVVVNLFFEGDPTTRRFAIPDVEGYAIEHRSQLLGEVLGMVERWRAAGMPSADVNTRFNKQGWGRIVGGILEASGEPDFLANAEAVATQLDSTKADFAELMTHLVDHPQGNWTPGELAELATKFGLLRQDLGDGNLRSRATRMGIVAGRFVAERFDLPDQRSATFIKSADRNGTTYKVGVDETAERWA